MTWMGLYYTSGTGHIFHRTAPFDLITVMTLVLLICNLVCVCGDGVGTV